MLGLKRSAFLVVHDYSYERGKDVLYF